MRLSFHVGRLSAVARVALVLLCAAVARDAWAARTPIRWISDDASRALAEGRRRDALVVVDAWAPW